MATFKLPLSGDVVQTISPWTAFMSPIGSQFGLVNITLGQSSEPAVEADALSDVASYGKQLGRIGDALIVLLAHFPRTGLSKEETDAIDDLEEMLRRIADVKDKHNRKALRPRAHQAASPTLPSPTVSSPSPSSPGPSPPGLLGSASSPQQPEPAPPPAEAAQPPPGRPTRRTSKGG
jgi:hypothetical protein